MRSLLLLEGEREESRIRELSARLCEEFSVHEEVSLCHCFNLCCGRIARSYWIFASDAPDAMTAIVVSG